jgi:hypothetical protein
MVESVYKSLLGGAGFAFSVIPQTFDIHNIAAPAELGIRGKRSQRASKSTSAKDELRKRGRPF